MLVLLSLFLFVLILQLAFNRHFVPEHRVQGDRAAELASRLDPNTADWQALAAIPNIGEKRAKDIVSYRDRVHGTNPGAVVFKTIYDLRIIRGVGPAMVEKLRPYLIFPGERSESLPQHPDDQDAPQ